MFKYYLAITIGGILTTGSQLLLKQGAISSKGKGFLKTLFNFYVISGYFFLVLMTLANLYALKKVPLLTMVVVFALVQVAVIAGSVIIFDEKLSKKQTQGIFLILVGISVFHSGF